MIASLARLWRDVRLPRPTAADWDRAYAGGRWDFLWNQAESPRVAMVAHYVRLALPPDAVVLDLGCGEGPLLDAVAPLPFRAYLGVDLSPVAIERAQARATNRSRFAIGDAATFVPDEAPHVIVLNEILYYLPDPEACVRRLLACLRPVSYTHLTLPTKA